MIRVFVCLGLFFGLGATESVWSQERVATKLRLISAGATLHATIGKRDVQIAEAALKAWLIDGGRAVLYSWRDGAGGYENEGQSLHIYDVSTGTQRRILSERFMIVAVNEAKTKSGKTALLVKMIDGGLGASHVAVVDPARGEVFSADRAEIIQRRAGEIFVGFYDDQDWDKLRAKQRVTPRKIERQDLDELLTRAVILKLP